MGGVVSFLGVRSQRTELAISFSDDDAKSWAVPVIIARQAAGSVCYPFILEPQAGEMWIWTRYGSTNPRVCLKLIEPDLVNRLGSAR